MDAKGRSFRPGPQDRPWRAWGSDRDGPFGHDAEADPTCCYPQATGVFLSKKHAHLMTTLILASRGCIRPPGDQSFRPHAPSVPLPTPSRQGVKASMSCVIKWAERCAVPPLESLGLDPPSSQVPGPQRQCFASKTPPGRAIPPRECGRQALRTLRFRSFLGPGALGVPIGTVLSWGPGRKDRPLASIERPQNARGTGPSRQA